jgi:hypothetical protein
MGHQRWRVGGPEHVLDSKVPEELGFQASAVVKAITDLAPLLRS